MALNITPQELSGICGKTSCGLLHCRFEPSYATIISGEDEGLYGWIAVNYLNGHLAPAAKPAPVVRPCAHLFTHIFLLCQHKIILEGVNLACAVPGDAWQARCCCE